MFGMEGEGVGEQDLLREVDEPIQLISPMLHFSPRLNLEASLSACELQLPVSEIQSLGNAPTHMFSLHARALTHTQIQPQTHTLRHTFTLKLTHSHTPALKPTQTLIHSRQGSRELTEGFSADISSEPRYRCSRMWTGEHVYAIKQEQGKLDRKERINLSKSS